MKDSEIMYYRNLFFPSWRGKVPGRFFVVSLGVFWFCFLGLFFLFVWLLGFFVFTYFLFLYYTPKTEKIKKIEKERGKV